MLPLSTDADASNQKNERCEETMKKQTLGMKLASLRKEKGTQMDLNSVVGMLGIGLASLAVSLLPKKEE